MPDKEIAALSSQQTAYRHLFTIPGVGPLIAAAFISEVDAVQFSSGRELSAWCGLVPRQHSSGGKQKLSSVTKNDNRSLRTPVIHGARSVMRCVKKRDDSMGHWLKRLEARRGFLKTIVALENKLTRIIWRILTDDFNMNKAFAMRLTNTVLKETCLSEFAGTDEKTATVAVTACSYPG